MSNLNLAFIKHLETADFFANFTEVREGVLETGNNNPALIYEVMPTNYDEQIEQYTDTLIIAIIDKDNSLIIEDLSIKVQKFVMEMRGKDVQGILVQHIFRPLRTKRHFDAPKHKIMFLQTFEITWSL